VKTEKNKETKLRKCSRIEGKKIQSQQAEKHSQEVKHKPN